MPINERSCVFCRTKTDKVNLIRIVKTKDMKLYVQSDKPIFGRGVYICKNLSCVEGARKKGAIGRAFKMKTDDDIYKLVEEMIGVK